MWSRIDSQDVGLEAATIQRVRNSSLVEWFRANNLAGLKSITEAMDFNIEVCLQISNIMLEW